MAAPSSPAGAPPTCIAPCSKRSRLTPDAYSLTQLRYDVRKLRAHGLLEREGRTLLAIGSPTKGGKVAALFVLFHKRVCGPVGQYPLSPPAHEHTPRCPPRSKRRTTRPMSRFKRLIDLVAA